MKAQKFVTIPLIVLLAMILAVQGLFAQGSGPISASVDRNTLTTDDLLNLTIVVNTDGRNAASPQLPALDGFVVAGSNSSTQMSIVNGEVTSSQAFNYQLQPYETGALTIGPATVVIDGQSYATDPITVQVSQGTGQPSTSRGTAIAGQPSASLAAPSALGRNEVFVEALVDNAEPYVGEQVAFTFRMYEAADSLRMPSVFGGQPSYEAPALTGFWSEGEPEQNSYRTSIGGRLYTVTELRSVLFPTAAGEVTIEPARLTIPGFGFQRGGAVQTEPVVVNVQPLPAGAPANFAGAVGQYAIQASVDMTETKVDEPVTLKVTLTGRGNVSTAADPQWPEVADWRVFESDGAVNTQIQDGALVGNRIYERLMVPTAAGVFTLPAIEYSYFDPAAGSYQSIATEPVQVNVLPGAPGATAAATNSVQNTDMATQDLSVEGARLLELRQASGKLNLASPLLASQSWYWLLWTLPLAAIAGGFVWQRRRLHHETNASAIRSAQAQKNASKALHVAEKQAGQPEEKVQAASRILREYIEARLDRPVLGMTNAALGELLTSQGVNAAAVHQALAILDASEHTRFGPNAMSEAQAATLLDQTASVIQSLEQVL